ncbi:FAD-dependent thymidylate synthase [Paenibacillus sp. FSL H3-0286]|uniref:FAD-dependent thymidylate synthase n=1 Tax=Paenibacillus sp. FSL H3-0286 TaxID=2921427 RepID=UPI0032457AEF
MNIQLIAHTQLSQKYRSSILSELQDIIPVPKDSQIISLVAIRTCYSPNKPTDIVDLEGKKYFGNKATDGETGTEADRLFRHITSSGHTSTLEHLNYTFSIEGVSRALMAQLTRHRHLSFSIQSMRYVPMSTESKSNGFNYIVPEKVDDREFSEMQTARDIFEEAMRYAQSAYDQLRKAGVPQEDARAVIPQAATTNIVMTGNLRTLLDFYTKRKPGKGAQHEITQLAEGIKSSILEVDPWLEKYFL